MALQEYTDTAKVAERLLGPSTGRIEDARDFPAGPVRPYGIHGAAKHVLSDYFIRIDYVNYA